MAYSERIGFSTGALAKGNFRYALNLLRESDVSVVELSALREDELPGLMSALSILDFAGFSYLSVHAPSKLERLSEIEVCHLLKSAAQRKLPIVVHPDIIQNPELWAPFGSLLLIENLDKRKSIGRTTSELQEVFSWLPQARFCCDVAHARQVDPTMAEAAQMLRLFGSRLVQVHASGLTAKSTHSPLSEAAGYAISQIAQLVPASTIVILESPVDTDAIQSEIAYAERAFSPWFGRLCADIDSVFNQQTPIRKKQIVAFLRLLELTNTRLSEFEHVLKHLPSGRAISRGDLLLGTQDLLETLSDHDKEELQDYLNRRVSAVASEFPDLRQQFRAQFS